MFKGTPQTATVRHPVCHLGLWLCPVGPQEEAVPGARLSVLTSAVPGAAPRAAWSQGEVHSVCSSSAAQGHAGCGRAELSVLGTGNQALASLATAFLHLPQRRAATKM